MKDKFCKHDRTEIQHKVVRTTTPNEGDFFFLDLKLKCLDCYSFFGFHTRSIGLSYLEPMSSADGHEIRIPLKYPEPEKNN